MDFEKDIEKETGLRVQPVPTFAAAVEFARNELAAEGLDDYYFVDIDKTLDSNPAMRYPFISKKEESRYTHEDMLALKSLYEFSGENVCIATNRKLHDPIWNSRGVVGGLYEKMQKYSLPIQIFVNLNRLVPIDNYEYRRMNYWILRNHKKSIDKPMRLIVISDFDLFGLSVYEGFFLAKVRKQLKEESVQPLGQIDLMHLQIKPPSLLKRLF